MNGGVGHVPAVLTQVEVSAAIAGFRYFGMNEVAELLRGIEFAREQDFEHLDQMYGTFIASDSTISDAFEAKLVASPEDFAPVEDEA